MHACGHGYIAIINIPFWDDCRCLKVTLYMTSVAAMNVEAQGSHNNYRVLATDFGTSPQGNYSHQQVCVLTVFFLFLLALKI